MSEQPEALRLADWLESEDMPTEAASCAEAAALLRSQRARIERLEQALNEGLQIFVNPVFGTWQYMEGSAFYEDVAALVKTFRQALEQQ